ncbi:ricin-type beta-trefoil lectin domain protein [Embleya sp. NPDC005971]|uniref:ricin-type beta-trefoil lectin domain protein n=1 Tax=Embleya sp. NPDC005971 TaxID=3156724 RepID=UPI00340071BA
MRKRNHVFVAATAALAAATLLAAAPTQAAAPLKGRYLLKNVGSGLCLTSSGKGDPAITVKACNDNNRQYQVWGFSLGSVGEGTVRVVDQKHYRCLDTSGTRAFLRDCENNKASPSQSWETAVFGGVTTLQTVAGRRPCLDVHSKTHAVQTTTCRNNDAAWMEWKLLKE